MRLFRFARDSGTTIDRYNSSGFTLAGVAHLMEEAMIQCAFLDPGGSIGYHQAAVPQLFLVIQGEGWVRGQAPERTRIQAGQAAYWEKGEWHEAGTESGMNAIIIETLRFNTMGWTPLE